MIICMLFVTACAPVTSLNGTTSCPDQVGSAEICGPRQLCISGRATPDDGSIPAMCTAVPLGCEVFNCVGADCPDCVLRMCQTYPNYVEGTRLSGRILQCP